jgi:hypothetical protein
MQQGQPESNDESLALGKLAEALAKAQGEFRPIIKDKTARIEGKGNYSYSYADLATVLEAVRGVLSRNGLALVQRIMRDAGSLYLETRLIHSSGQTIASEYPLPQAGGRPQEMGSAIQYARRYSVCALLMLSPDEDDDGQAAEHVHDDRPADREERTIPQASAGAACPTCGRLARVSKYAKPGATHYCPVCKVKGATGADVALTFEPQTAREPGEDDADDHSQPDPASTKRTRPVDVQHELVEAARVLSLTPAQARAALKAIGYASSKDVPVGMLDVALDALHVAAGAAGKAGA